MAPPPRAKEEVRATDDTRHRAEDSPKETKGRDPCEIKRQEEPACWPQARRRREEPSRELMFGVTSGE